MNKKFFYGMMAATMLFATSCQQDDVLVQGGEATISFQVSTPEIATRAFSDGNTANHLTYVVYTTGGEIIKEGNTTFDNRQAQVQVQLAKGNTYNVLFWADAWADDDANSPYTVNALGKTLEVNYTGVNCNDENLDAFYSWETITVSASGVENVELRRPFAQLNIGTGDLDEAAAANLDIENIKTQVVVALPTTMNFASGEVGQTTQEVTFAYSNRPAREGENAVYEVFPVAGYDYLAMNYLLVGANKTITDVTFSYQVGTNVQTREFNNIPVQRNYRTNIYGNLLTESTEFNVEIKPAYVDDITINNEGVVVMNVATMDELQDAIDNASGNTTIKFKNDIDITTTRATDNIITVVEKPNLNLTIDGCGKMFNGSFQVHNRSSYNNGAVTFTAINFETTTATYFISAVDFGNGNRYSQNITVNGCTFIAPDDVKESVVGVQVNATKNLVIRGCTATNMHSLLQAQSCDGEIIVDGVTVRDCKNGVSFGNTAYPVLRGATIQADGYGVRADGNASRGDLVIEKVTINAAQPVIVRKVTTAGYAVELGNDVVLNPTVADDYQVVLTKGNDDAVYVEPEVDFTFNSVENYKVFPELPNVVVAATADEFTAALANAEVAEIFLAENVTIVGTFTVNRNVTIKPANVDNKATIKGRVNVVGDGVNATFENVVFAANDASKVVWTNGGSIMKQKPSIVMAENNGGVVAFRNCDFNLAAGAYGYTNSSSGKGVFSDCSFNGNFNYAMYVRANIEVTNCVYNTSYTNVVVGACVSALENGKVVYVNNVLNNAANIGMSGAIVFTSTNNTIDGVWAGPVEFTVKGNEGFQYAYERMNNFKVLFEDHTFTEGSETFNFE